MYGFWIKPDRFANFQEFIAVYLNQLKALAYRFEDMLTGKTVRFHKAGIDGYVVEAKTYGDIENAMISQAFAAAQKKSIKYDNVTQVGNDLVVKGTIVENVIAGSVAMLFTTVSGKEFAVIDSGDGILRIVDKSSSIGSIDYATGKFSCTLPNIDASEVSDKDISIAYAVTGTNAAYVKFDGTITGTTKELKVMLNGQIPNTQVGHTCSIYTVADCNKMFIGFTTANDRCVSEIVSELTGVPVTVATTT